MSDIQIECYTDARADQWNEFVEKSDNGTIFHRLDFLDYHGGKFKTNSKHIVFLEHEKIVAVLPLGLFEEDQKIICKSPFGASYGGFVFDRNLTLEKAEKVVSVWVDFLKENGVNKARIVLAPNIYKSVQNDYIEFFLMKCGAVCENSELSAYISIDEQTEGNFLSHARKNVNKAQRENLRFDFVSDVKPFYSILLANREKFKAIPTHSREEVQWLVERFPQDVRMSLIYDQTNAIASCLTFRCNTNVLQVFYWAHLEEYQQLRPINLLVYSLINYARKEGVKYIDFGPQTLNQEPNYGAAAFKESFGAKGVLRNRYTLELS